MGRKTGTTATNVSDIYSASQQCRALFLRYLKEPRQNEALIQQYLHQFLTWASFLGVFAPPNASLDARLRGLPDIKGLVMSMLAVLHRTLRQGISGDLAGSSGGPESSDVLVRGITGALERLQRLAVAIRQSQRTDEVARVQAFAKKLEDEYLEDIVRIWIKFHIGKSAPASLSIQLAKSVMYRRYRLLYQRRHNRKLQSERKQEIGEEIPLLVEHKSTEMLQEEHTLTLKPAALRSELSPTLPSIRNLKNNGLGNSQSKARESHSSPSSFVSSNQSARASYPEKPSVPAGKVDTACSYCCNKLHRNDLKSNKWWRSHLDDDLRLYVCISTDCGELPPTFPTRKDWDNHMQIEHHHDWARLIHRPFAWICIYGHNPPLNFISEASFRQHLLSEHARDFDSDQQLSSVVERSKIPIARALGECPLCGVNICNPIEEVDEQPRIREPGTRGPKKVTFQGNDEDYLPASKIPAPLNANDNCTTTVEGFSDRLSHHIAEHLKTIGFISIRWWAEEVSLEQDHGELSNLAADISGSNFDGESISSGSIFLNDDTLDELRLVQELSILEEQQGAGESAEEIKSKPNKQYLPLRDAIFDEGAQGDLQLNQLPPREEIQRKDGEVKQDVTVHNETSSDEELENDNIGKFSLDVESDSMTLNSSQIINGKDQATTKSLEEDEDSYLNPRAELFKEAHGVPPLARYRRVTAEDQYVHDEIERKYVPWISDDNSKRRFREKKGKGKESELNPPELDQSDPFAKYDDEDPNSVFDMTTTEYLSGYDADTGNDWVEYASDTDDLNPNEMNYFDNELALAMEESRTVAYSAGSLGEPSTTYEQANEPITADYSNMPDPLSSTPEFLTRPSGKNTYKIQRTYSYMEEADPRFRIHNSREFTIGAVFSVLWRETRWKIRPTSEDDTPTLITVADEIRVTYPRFIIIATDEGHSTCVPILTYEGRACKKTGVKQKKHGIIYSHGSKPRPLKDEPKLGFDPVKLTEYDGVEDRLEKASRVNYSKLVTIEHNVKVRFLGAIDERHLEVVQGAVNACWADKMLKPGKSSRNYHSAEHHRSKKGHKNAEAL